MDDDVRIRKKLLDFERRVLLEKEKLELRNLGRQYIKHYREERKMRRRANLKKYFKIENLAIGAISGTVCGLALRSLIAMNFGLIGGVIISQKNFEEKWV